MSSMFGSNSEASSPELLLNMKYRLNPVNSDAYASEFVEKVVFFPTYSR